MSSSSSTVADHVVDFLEDRSVPVVFGLCGHTNISLLAALGRSDSVRFVTARHEQVALHAADGYARVTGRPGVALVHVGPGLTNAMTGIATAAMDSIPLVVLCGDVPTYYEGRGPHQEVNQRRDADQRSLVDPFVKRSWRVQRADQLPRILARAWDIARLGRPGPVLVSLPMDLLVEPLAAPVWPASQAEVPGLSPEQSERVATALLAARRPLLLVGGGTRSARASKAVQKVVESANVPVAHTLMGTGVLPADHPLNLGMLGFWGTPSANAVAREADLIIAIGTRFAETDSSSWVDGVTFSIPPTRLIHIDIDPSEIGRNYPTEQGYVADAERSLVAIAEAVAKFDPPTRDYDLASLATEVARFRSSGSENAKSNAFPLMPERILSDLYAVAGENITLVTDVGWNKNGVGQQYPISSTQGFLTPGGFSTMGFGPAAVLGVTLANPERKAVALVGDGAFSSVPQAVPTAVEMGIAPIWVVMNNSSFGTISGLQQKHYGSSYGCDFRTPEDEAYSPDFAAWARACGAEGRTVARPSDFAEYLQEALASNRPTVIDVPMTNTPVPTPGLWDIERIYERDSSRARP